MARNQGERRASDADEQSGVSEEGTPVSDSRFPFGWSRSFLGGDPEDGASEYVGYENESYGEQPETGDVADDDAGDGWFTVGLPTVTLAVGLLLFVFPEPATSAFGLLLVGLGAVMWLFKLVL